MNLVMNVKKYTASQGVPTTMSHGHAVWKANGDTLDDLIGFADKMMYQKK